MKSLRWLGALLVVALPLALLADLGANFFYDWHNHQWLVGYFGEYFRQHGAMPTALNVEGAVGMPQPVFYGFLLYPALGLLSAAMGAGLAIRVGALAAYLAQFAAVYLAGKNACRSRGLGFAMATAATWSIHAMTNLYNRAALTEFFATTFLTTAVAWGAAALAEERLSRRRLCLGLAGLFLALTLGSHPPTALVGSGLVALLGAIALALAWRRRAHLRAELRTAGGFGLLVVLAVAPWVQANLEFRHDLGVVGRYRELSLNPARTDAVWVRLSPVPFDPEVLAKGRLAEGTPYVEAPLAFALLVLGGWNVILLRRMRAEEPGAATTDAGAKWFLAAGAGWFALMLAASLARPVADALRFLAAYVQFATRFTSHANLGLLVAVLASGALVARRGGYARHARASIGVAMAALAISLAGVIVKLGHGRAAQAAGNEPHYAWRGDRAAMAAPGRTDAAGDYAAIRRMPQLAPAVAREAVKAVFPVGARGAKFGVVQGAAVELAHPGWVVTNAVIFPWSRVTVDGAEVPLAQRAGAEFRWAARLPAGTHRLAWEWRPDPLWHGLRLVSQLAMVAMLAAVVALGWGELRGSR